MKKVLGLTSAALLGVVALTGCSVGSKGTYTLAEVEYVVGDETKTTTCENPAGLEELAACSMKDFKITLGKKNKGTIEAYGIESEIFYKIEDGKLMISYAEDEDYIDTGMVYKFAGKLVYEVDKDEDGTPDYTMTFKKN